MCGRDQAFLKGCFRKDCGYGCSDIVCVLEGEGNCSAFHGLLSFASGVSARPFSVGVYAVPSSSIGAFGIRAKWPIFFRKKEHSYYKAIMTFFCCSENVRLDSQKTPAACSAHKKDGWDKESVLCLLGPFCL
jgi:hypothetical protein